MNAEMARIRKLRNYNEVINREPMKIRDARLGEMVLQLNTNMYAGIDPNNLDIEDINNRLINNIYIILNMFNEMGVYPDYFFDESLKIKIEYKKLVEKEITFEDNYKKYNEVKNKARFRIENAVHDGLEKGYNRVQAYSKKNINDNFLEMRELFQALDIPYNLNKEENCQKLYQYVVFNHSRIIEELYNTMVVDEDIAVLTRLLFEYLSYFVSMGINPKSYLDNLIDSIEAQKGDEGKKTK